ncbi:hypothetical protein TI04_13305, partial [Achromatium sp. WMS2]
RRPPLGFFRNFILIHDGKHDDTLDLKHQGITPIIDIARIYALKSKLIVNNTIARLHGAQQSGILSQETAENLQDVFELISGLRLRHQAQQIRNGYKPDNYLAPNQLSSLERNHLKDAFKVISSIQQVMEQNHALGLIPH